jgi:hypothetical protein
MRQTASNPIADSTTADLISHELGSLHSAMAKETTSVHTLLSDSVRDFVRLPTRAKLDKLAVVVPEIEVILGVPLKEFPTLSVEREGVSTSERLLGKRILEFDRLLTSLRSIVTLLDAGQGCAKAYNHFTSSQNEASRLTEENFQRLAQTVHVRITSTEKEALLFLALINNTAAKTDHQNWKVLESQSVDRAARYLQFTEAIKGTDDHVVVLTKRLELLPEDFPSLSLLSPGESSIYSALVGETPNLGQLLQLEGMEGLLLKYPQLPEEVRALHFVQYLAQVCGARGHENELGSLTMTEDLAQRWLNLEICLSKKTPEEIYRGVLMERGFAYGVDPSNKEGRALIRLASMYGLRGPSEAAELSNALFSPLFPAHDRDIIITELSATGTHENTAILAYHAPALLKNALESGRKSPLCYLSGFGVGLRTLASILEHTRELVDNNVIPISEVSVREVARYATQLPLQPRGCISVSLENGRYSATISSEWRDFYEKLPAFDSVVESLLPKLQSSAHLYLDDIASLSSTLQTLVSVSTTSQVRPIEEREQLNLIIRQVYFLSNIVSLFIPYDLEVDKNARTETRTSLVAPTSYASKIGQSSQKLIETSSTLRKRISELTAYVVSDFTEIYPKNASEQLIEKLDEIERRCLELARGQNHYTVNLITSEGYSLLTIKDERQSSAEFVFTSGGCPHLFQDRIDLDGSYGEIATVHALQFTNCSSSQKANYRQLARLFFGQKTLPFHLSSSFSTHQRASMSEWDAQTRVVEAKNLLTPVREYSARIVDTISSTLKTNSHGDHSPVWNIVDLLAVLKYSSREYIVTGTSASKEHLLKEIEYVNKILAKYPEPAPGVTCVVDKATPKLVERLNQIEISTRGLRYDRTDPRMYEQGGCVLDISLNTLQTLIKAGATLIICQPSEGYVTGFKIVVPSATLAIYAPQLLKIGKNFGSYGLIYYLQVTPDLDPTIPTYDLLVNRFRIEAAGDDVALAQIAHSNKRSLYANLSSLGRAFLLPNYRTALMNQQVKIGSGGESVNNLTTGDFSAGIVAPVSDHWRTQFSSVGTSHLHTVTLVRSMVNRNLPSFFNRGIFDLAEMYRVICQRDSYLKAKIDDLSRSELKEITTKIPRWVSDVENFLTSYSFRPKITLEKLRSLDREKYSLIKDDLREDIPHEEVRKHLNYF